MFPKEIGNGPTSGCLALFDPGWRNWFRISRQVHVLYLYDVYWLARRLMMLTGYFFSDDGLSWDQNTWNTNPISGQKTTLTKRIIEHWIRKQSWSFGGGGSGSHFISPVWGVGRKGGRKQKVIRGLLGLQVKPRPFAQGIRKGFQLFCDWERRHQAMIYSRLWFIATVQSCGVLHPGSIPSKGF